MCNNNIRTDVGNYKVEVSSPKAQTVKSDVLPIYQGIKIYPLRFGVYEKRRVEQELIHIKISKDYKGEYILTNRNVPESLYGTETTRYPMLGDADLYDYFPMPLRDGWVYVVSKYARGIYEYQHLNYSFHLHRFYRSKKTEEYPKNTTWQNFIQCSDADEVYLFYSEIRLEENFIRSRLFKDDGNVYQTAFFSARKWLDKKDTIYKSDITKSRLSINDLRVSIPASSEGGAYENFIEKVCNELTVNEQKKANTGRQDVFLFIDDIIGIGKQFISDIQYKHVELQGLIKSLQTGISLDTILERFSNLDTESVTKIHSLSNKELFPDADCSESEYMHTTALLLKNFFYEIKIPSKEKDLKEYIEDGRGKIKKETLDAILGIDIRKEMCENIDKYRRVLHLFLKTQLFRNYCRFFLDKEEYAEVENESKLPFIVPKKFTYDFFGEGATYNAMISQIIELVMSHYETLSLSPYKTDMYLVGEDPYQDIIQQIKTLSGEKLEGPILLNKEMIGSEYFDEKQINQAASFFQRKDFPTWETLYSVISIGSSILELLTERVLDRKVPASIQWQLQEGANKSYSLANRKVGEKGIKYSVVMENDGGLLARVVDPKGNITEQQLKFPESPDIQVVKTGKGGNLKIKKGTYRSFSMNADGTFSLAIDLFPKANWSAVKNPGALTDYIKLKSPEILKKMYSNKYFSIAMPMLAFYLISKTLQDPDRAALRKANDVTMYLAILGAVSADFLPKIIAEGSVKNPLANIKIYDKALRTRIPAQLIFRSFVIVANVCAGFEGVVQGSELWNNGNTIAGALTFSLGLILVFSSVFFAFGPLGWAAYLLITILASLAMIFVSFFVDSDLEIFLENTVFHLAYTFKYTQKGSIHEKMNAVYEDILKLSTDKNKQISRKTNKEFMTNFKYQLDELAMIYLFAPSFHECSYIPVYNMQRYTPQRYDTMYPYPSSVIISVSGIFSIFSSILEEIEMDVYMSKNGDPEWDNLIPLSRYRSGTETLCINGRMNAPNANHWIVNTDEEAVKYESGNLQYHFRVDADTYGKKVRDLATYPFFQHDTYFIFMYIRFRVKGGDWMPSNRTQARHYLMYRYQLNKQVPYSKYTPHNYADYKIQADKITIRPLPPQKLK